MHGLSQFIDDTDMAPMLLKQLDISPLIASVCSFPLNCAITCILWRTLKQELPTTMTELYSKIVLNMLFRNINKFSEHSHLMSLRTFNSIPQELKLYWWNLRLKIFVETNCIL